MQKAVLRTDRIRFLLFVVSLPTPEAGVRTEKPHYNSIGKGRLKAVASWLS